MKVINHILFDNDIRVPYKQSPNHGGVITPTYGVIHYDASPNDTGAVAWMTNIKSKVSAHIHITRSGKVTQLLPLNIKGQHAGTSLWKGISGLNSHSIGIELQNTGNQDYTGIQMDVLIEVVKALNVSYPIKEWVGHSDISPGRKVDPGVMFDWNLFRHGIEEVSTTSDLNLREGAGVQYEKIVVLPKGTDVKVLKVEKEWSMVNVPSMGRTGYVSNKYLTVFN